MAETNPGLASLENPDLMRRLGLILVNADGFDAGRAGRAVRAARHAKRAGAGQLVDLLPLELGNVDAPLQGELDVSQCVAKRQGMVCYVYDEGDNVVIGFPGGKLSGPASIKPLLQFIARASEPFLLSALPGALSLRSKEAVVRRLVREGLLFFPAE